MGSLTDDIDDPDRSPRASLIQRLAHLLPVALVIFIAYTLASWFYVIPQRSWIAVATPFLYVIPVMAFVFHSEYARLCLKCMQQVPNDASAKAEKNRWLLRVYHMSLSTRYLVVFIGLSVIYGLIQGLSGLWLPWISAPSDIMIGVWIWAQWKHHRYRPWCPYCRRWDDGGSHEHAPDPVIPAEKVS